MKQSYLAIGAIMKNEALYLRDWLLFHARQGVRVFYLFDNDSDDGSVEVALRCVDELPDSVCLSINHITGPKAQFPAYDKILRSAREDGHTWLALIDIDEYLFSPTGAKLPDVLANYEQHSGVVVHWVLYGSAGEKEYKPGSVRDRFQWRAAEVDRHVKTICKPKHVERVITAHIVDYLSGGAVDENHWQIPSFEPRPENATANILRINHYVTKSEAEARIKCARGRADIGAGREFETFFPAHDCNEVLDPIISEE